MSRTEGDKPAGRFAPLDLYELAWASDPQLSPDGRRVAFLRNQPDLKTDRVRRALRLAEVDGGGDRILVDEAFEPLFPRWSPDGRRIALLTTLSGRQRIELIDADGGGRCVFEPEGLSVSGLAWSPDSSAIAFAGRAEIVAEDGWSLPRKPDGADWAPRPVVIDRLPFRSDDQGPEKPFRSNIHLLRPADGEIVQLTDSDHIDAREGHLAWTPDGEMVLFAANRESPAGVDAWDTRIYGVKTGSRTVMRLTLGVRDSAPAVSPDGGALVFLRREDLDAAYTTPRLYRQAMAGGVAKRLAPDLDCPLRDPRWAPDGCSVRALADRQGRTSIVEIGPDGACRTLVETVGGGWVRHPYLGGSFSQSESGALAFGSWSESRPPEVAVAAPGADQTIVTRLNADWAEARDLGSISPVCAKSGADGASVEGWMLRPPGFDPARRYPMILDIHGGPWADYGPQFSVVSHLWAAAGYIVLFGNPRGSTSYGEAFASGINHAFPSIDYDDLMALTDAALATGTVDAENLFVTGGSGGGALTAWIVGTTDRFRAACSVKPCINWMSWALTVDLQDTPELRNWFPTAPWLDPDFLWRLSPLSRAHKVRTPTMLICGELDLRTPIAESEQYFTVLQKCGAPSALVRLPGTNHLGGRPSHWLAHALYALDWFERYRTGARPG